MRAFIDDERAGGASLRRSRGGALHLRHGHLQGCALELFELGHVLHLSLSHRREGDLPLAEDTRPDQKNIFERDPTGVLEETPPLRIGHAITQCNILIIDNLRNHTRSYVIVGMCRRGAFRAEVC